MLSPIVNSEKLTRHYAIQLSVHLLDEVTDPTRRLGRHHNATALVLVLLDFRTTEQGGVEGDAGEGGVEQHDARPSSACRAMERVRRFYGSLVERCVS